MQAAGSASQGGRATLPGQFRAGPTCICSRAASPEGVGPALHSCWLLRTHRLPLRACPPPRGARPCSSPQGGPWFLRGSATLELHCLGLLSGHSLGNRPALRRHVDTA